MKNFKEFKGMSLTEAVNSGKFSMDMLYGNKLKLEFKGVTYFNCFVPKTMGDIIITANNKSFSIEQVGLENISIQ